MPAPDSTRHRMRPLTPIAAAVVVGTSMLLSAGIAHAGSVPKKCPTPASIQKAAGVSLTRSLGQRTSNALLCSYNAGKNGSVTITAGPLPGVTAAEFASVVQLEAKKAHLSKVSGIGSFAFEFTQNDAKDNPNGIATTGVFALVGTDEFDVLGTIPAKNILAVAKVVVG